MFFEVRVYRPDGKLKKTISRTELSKGHWKQFEKTESQISLNSPGMKPVPAWVKHKLDLEFPTHLELYSKSF
jgi:hypothetical protein